MNAYYLEKMRYGKRINDLSKEEVMDFILQIPRFSYYLKEYKSDPDQYASKISELVEKEATKKTPFRYKINASLIKMLSKQNA